MARERYIKMLDFFKAKRQRFLALKLLYKALPLLMFICYPALLLYILIIQRDLFLKTALVPLGVFLLVTLLRVVINEPRPYEKYGAPSLFEKQTHGKSMPSRHTASAFVIAIAFLSFNTACGITALTIAAGIAATRVLSGVHYIRDVIAGAAIGIFGGLIMLII